MAQLHDDGHTLSKPVAQDRYELHQHRLDGRPVVDDKPEQPLQHGGELRPGIPQELVPNPVEGFCAIYQAPGVLHGGLLYLAGLVKQGIHADLGQGSIVQGVQLRPEAHFHRLRLPGGVVDMDTELLQGAGIPVDVVLHDGQGLGIVHAEGVPQVIGQGRGDFGQLRGGLSSNAQLGIHGLVGHHEALDLSRRPMDGGGVVLHPFAGIGPGEGSVEAFPHTLSSSGDLDGGGAQLFELVDTGLDSLQADYGGERPFQGLLDLLSGIPSSIAHVVQVLPGIVGGVPQVLGIIGGGQQGGPQLSLDGLDWVGKGRPDILGPRLEGGHKGPHLLLGVAYGPLEARLEALGGAPALTQGCTHRLRHGLPKAAGIGSHAPERVPELVASLVGSSPDVVQVPADVAGGVFSSIGSTSDAVGQAVQTSSPYVGPGLDVGPHIPASSLGSSHAVDALLQADDKVIQFVDAFIQAKVEAERHFSAVSHYGVTSLCTKRGGQALSLAPHPLRVSTQC